jgi:hypothetical protein
MWHIYYLSIHLFVSFIIQIYLTRRRLQEEETDKQPAAITTHRELTVWTPDTCYSACAARLGNPPTFVINIYNNETSGEQVGERSILFSFTL